FCAATRLGTKREQTLRLLDVNGFYSRLGEFLDHLVTEQFVRAPHRAMLQLAQTPAELVSQLHDWRPTALPKWG
ncbi:LOG family protein, partial [Pseudomonas sp. 21C1]